MFEAFDMPDTHESCARRANTTSSPQALELLNNELVLGLVEEPGGPVSNDSGLTADAQVDRACRLAYSRAPTASRDADRAPRSLDRQTKIAGNRRVRRFVDLCHMLLNSNEFVYMN